MNLKIFLLLVLYMFEISDSHRQRPSQLTRLKNSRDKITGLIGSIRNLRFTYDPQRNRRAKSEHLLPSIGQSRFKKRPRHQPRVSRDSKLKNRPEGLNLVTTGRGYTQPPQPPPTPIYPQPSTSSSPIYQQTVYQPAETTSTTPPPPPEPSYSQQPETSTYSLPSIPPTYSQPETPLQPVYSQQFVPIVKEPEAPVQQVYTTPTEPPTTSTSYTPAPSQPPITESQPLYVKDEPASTPEPIYIKQEDPEPAVREEPQQQPYAKTEPSGSYLKGAIFPSFITSSFAEFSSSSGKDAIGNISPFSYFKSPGLNVEAQFSREEPLNALPDIPVETVVTTDSQPPTLSYAPSPTPISLAPYAPVVTEATTTTTPTTTTVGGYQGTTRSHYGWRLLSTDDGISTAATLENLAQSVGYGSRPVQRKRKQSWTTAETKVDPTEDATNSVPPIFYFNSGDNIDKETQPEATSNPPTAPGEIYFKPLPDSPENPPKVEPSAQPTPSPVYYKYSIDTEDVPVASPSSETEVREEPQSEPKEADSLADEGYPSQNFVNQETFRIPEAFRNFLNTPPKWINMKNW